MSEAASVPFSETKAPEYADRLHRGALGLVDIRVLDHLIVGDSRCASLAERGCL